MRVFLGDKINIDGRMIGYRIETAYEYLIVKGLKEDEIESFDNDIYKKINQIIALKQSCWLLRRTSHSCQSLSADLYDLKERLINELLEEHNYIFDDSLMEEYCSF